MAGWVEGLAAGAAGSFGSAARSMAVRVKAMARTVTVKTVRTTVRPFGYDVGMRMSLSGGPRPDKQLDIEPIHRAALADLTFGELDRVEVDLSDLELAQFTRTHELDARFKARDGQPDVWHVVGSDLIKGGRDGRAFIQQQ